MNAIQLLEEQHEDVDRLIKRLEQTQKGARGAIFAELADKLAAHAKIEEELFYPAVMAKQTEDILLESVEEHLAVKRLLADMLLLDVHDDQFDAKLSVMKEQIEHHAHEEEEKELFPKVEKLLGKDALEGLGGEMSARYEELMAGSPRYEVPGETGQAAPL